MFRLYSTDSFQSFDILKQHLSHSDFQHKNTQHNAESDAPTQYDCVYLMSFVECSVLTVDTYTICRIPTSTSAIAYQRYQKAKSEKQNIRLTTFSAYHVTAMVMQVNPSCEQ